jgi:SAM-dependent methyltransferase
MDFDRGELRCSICDATALTDIPSFHLLRRITSDCRAWPAGGRLAVCGACGAAQKPADARFLSDTEEIYRSYAIYHQGDGAEQSVFQATSGLSVSRSAQLIETFRRHMPLAARGRLLDMGCGNGSMLRAFGQLYPGWIKVGTEFDERHGDAVAAIPNTEPLYTGPLEDLPSPFDVITMIHVLEHMPDPVACLRTLRKAFSDDGLLLIEVPHHTENPFDLLIADHRTHFTAASLRYCLLRAGYEVIELSADWIPRELSAVARPAPIAGLPLPEDADAVRGRISEHLAWLQRAAESVKALGAVHSTGIFGTSIAGTWLAAQADADIAFFVDEDANRTGRLHLGKPVLAPEHVPQGSHVFVGLPTLWAKSICHRLTRPDVTFVPPS